MQLWLATDGTSIKAAAATEVIKEPSRNVLEIAVCGGTDLDAWIRFERDMAEAAKREMQVSVVRTLCRPGMMRKLETRGFSVKGYILERSL